MTMRSLLPILTCMMAGSGVWAQSITVNVSGSLQQSGCTPSLLTSLVGGNVVTLPAVNISDMQTAGASVGQVQLHFRAVGCTGNVDYMWVHFTAPNVDSNGRMVPTSGTQNVRFELRDHTASGARVRVGGSAGSSPTSNQGTVAAFSGSYPANSSRQADKYYYVRYYVQAPVTVAGNVSTTATANFKYY